MISSHHRGPARLEDTENTKKKLLVLRHSCAERVCLFCPMLLDWNSNTVSVRRFRVLTSLLMGSRRIDAAFATAKAPHDLTRTMAWAG